MHLAHASQRHVERLGDGLESRIVNVPLNQEVTLALRKVVQVGSQEPKLVPKFNIGTGRRPVVRQHLFRSDPVAVGVDQLEQLNFRLGQAEQLADHLVRDIRTAKLLNRLPVLVVPVKALQLGTREETLPAKLVVDRASNSEGHVRLERCGIAYDTSNRCLPQPYESCRAKRFNVQGVYLTEARDHVLGDPKRVLVILLE